MLSNANKDNYVHRPTTVYMFNRESYSRCESVLPYDVSSWIAEWLKYETQVTNSETCRICQDNKKETHRMKLCTSDKNTAFKIQSDFM
jgi:hypothetical protein